MEKHNRSTLKEWEKLYLWGKQQAVSNVHSVYDRKSWAHPHDWVCEDCWVAEDCGWLIKLEVMPMTRKQPFLIWLNTAGSSNISACWYREQLLVEKNNPVLQRSYQAILVSLCVRWVVLRWLKWSRVRCRQHCSLVKTDRGKQHSSLLRMYVWIVRVATWTTFNRYFSLAIRRSWLGSASDLTRGFKRHKGHG